MGYFALEAGGHGFDSRPAVMVGGAVVSAPTVYPPSKSSLLTFNDGVIIVWATSTVEITVMRREPAVRIRAMPKQTTPPSRFGSVTRRGWFIRGLSKRASKHPGAFAFGGLVAAWKVADTLIYGTEVRERQRVWQQTGFGCLQWIRATYGSKLLVRITG